MSAPKKKYFPPVIILTYVELEEAIAAGSATVHTPNVYNEIKDQWIVEDTDYKTIDW
ncbi:hypothetical protein LZQ00_17125 [Sphingobacterium sp. SRCM116780]|uniref:hypothetical protein n=1 Tax=Sphingobacterium sp. SRCM116780 TaxID=2907623 RepID=UPI001F1C0BFE|nr:hypothetical protein [Sphingobacterium sp. SRCM116780]UIR55972.1 hypothetical protein LZQ00_17125 [Sphingobacterium sp. SRCM116780]